jgi:MFS family permease
LRRGLGDAADSTGTAGLSVVLVLVLVMAVGPFVLYVMSSLGPVLIYDLHMTRTELGLISATFSLAAACSAPTCNHWLPRVGLRRTALAIFVSTGLALPMMSLARSSWALVPSAVLGGFAVGASKPLTNDVLLQARPSGQRGVLIWLKQSGVNAFSSAWLAVAMMTIIAEVPNSVSASSPGR